MLADYVRTMVEDWLMMANISQRPLTNRLTDEKPWSNICQKLNSISGNQEIAGLLCSV